MSQAVKSNAKAPIGIFDSGIGGLTVARAVRDLLPHETLLYFGDTAHLPYGEKSAAAIQAYSIKITDIFLQAGAKLILIACNSASAAAYDLVREYVGSRAQVENVIDPAVRYVSSHFRNQKIGLIGTRRTVYSKIYEKKIQKLNLGITLSSMATPLLVPMIEEGFVNNDISKSIISSYLKDKPLRGIQALILGCTHYPLIKDEIQGYYDDKVEVIDSAEQVAIGVKAYLEKMNLLAPPQTPANHFLVSDYTRSSEDASKLFFKQKVKLEEYKLWE
jgi:glutamate racemase